MREVLNDSHLLFSPSSIGRRRLFDGSGGRGDIGTEDGTVAGGDGASERLEAGDKGVEACGAVGIHQDFHEQVLVFGGYAARYGDVAPEGSAGGFLTPGDVGECHRGGHRYGERIAHHKVVGGEVGLGDVEVERAVEVAEKRFAEVRSLADHYGVLVAQIVERGECRAEHGVGAHKRMARKGVEFRQSGFYGGYVAEDAARRQMWERLAECLKRMAYGGGVDKQLRGELVGLVETEHAPGIENEAHTLRVGVVERHIVAEREEVAEECAHFSGTEYQNLHRNWRLTE